MKNKYLLLLFALLFFHSLSAQKGTILGKLLDSTRQPIAYATVAAYQLSDSSVLNFGLSDERGEFQLSRLPQNREIRVIISHVSYKSVSRDVILDSLPFVLDSLILETANNELAETVITWEVPPIMVKNDTVEFNADAFIGKPGSPVEELLKRIPGIEVDDNGQITYQGRKVSRLTLDSKQFFSDDPAVLLKNMPAKAIESVQITEEKDLRGRELNSGNVTLNLTLKHWAKKSHFGKAYAGYGTDNRYEAGGIWNFLRDTTQLTIIGYGNNLSQTGFSFSDLYRMGGFNRSGYFEIDEGTNGMTINGASFGGGKGITESGGGGFNFNYDLPGKISLGTSYFIGLSSTVFLENKENTRFLGDSTLFLNSVLRENNQSTQHSFHARLKWIPDSINIITLRPLITFGGTRNNSTNSNFNSYSFSPNSSGFNNQLRGVEEGLKLNNDFSWDMALKRIQFYLTSFASYQDFNGDGFNNLENLFFSDTFNTRVEQRQTRQLENRNQMYSNSLAVTKKFNDSFKIVLTPSHTYYKAEKMVWVYEEDSLMEQTFVPNFSTQFSEVRNTMAGTFLLRRVFKKFTAIASYRYGQTQMALENQLSTVAVNRIFEVSTAQLSMWKYNPNGYFRFNYEYAVKLPNSLDLIELVDNTNPNFINRGNAFLEPSRNNGFNFSGNKGFFERKLNIYANFSGKLEQNAVIRETFIEESGRTINTAVNLDDGKNVASANGSINISWRQSLRNKWQVTPALNLSANTISSWRVINSVYYKFYSSGLAPVLSLTFFKKDYLDARLSFMPSYRRSHTPGLSEPILNQINRLTADIWWAPFEKFWVETKTTYLRQGSSVSNSIDQEMVLVNAALTYLVLKENRGQIRLSVFDLLKQNQQLFQVPNGNEIVTGSSNAVTRYFMMSFVYNFNSFNKPGRQSRGYSFW